MRYIFFLILLLLASCSEQKLKSKQNRQTLQYENFYFPVKNFFTEKTYCFENKNDASEKSQWRMKTIISNKDTLLQTSIFDSEDRITDTLTECVNNGNSKIIKYIMFNYDLKGKKLSSKCEIVDSIVFKRIQSRGDEFKWKVRFKDKISTNLCELSKTRKLTNQNRNFKTFTDSFKFVMLGSKKSYEYSMTSIYQKGKGLISYKLVLPDGKVKNFILMHIK